MLRVDEGAVEEVAAPATSPSSTDPRRVLADDRRALSPTLPRLPATNPALLEELLRARLPFEPRRDPVRPKPELPSGPLGLGGGAAAEDEILDRFDLDTRDPPPVLCPLGLPELLAAPALERALMLLDLPQKLLPPVLPQLVRGLMGAVIDDAELADRPRPLLPFERPGLPVRCTLRVMEPLPFPRRAGLTRGPLPREFAGLLGIFPDTLKRAPPALRPGLLGQMPPDGGRPPREAVGFPRLSWREALPSSTWLTCVRVAGSGGGLWVLSCVSVSVCEFGHVLFYSGGKSKDSKNVYITTAHQTKGVIFFS